MPRLSPLLRLALACGAFLAASLALATAEAQMLSFVQQGGILRHDQDPDVVGDFKINRRDCEVNDYFSFTLNPVGLGGTNYDVEVWMSESASTDCTNPSNQTAAAGVCRQVAQTVTNSYNIKVFVRDIVSNVWGAWDGGAMADVCMSDYEPPVKRTLQFFTVDFGSVPGTPLQYEVQYDLLGPGPPGSVNAGIGQNALVVSWKESSNAAEVSRYRVYAEPVSATGEGGASGDPGTGTDGGTQEPTACTSSVLNPGEPVPEGTRVRGEANASSTKAEATGLTNGVRYAVAVASVDDFMNSGNLSALDCGTPEPVTGFYEAYRAAGGEAGGGYCAIGGTPSRLSAAAAALAALGLILRRRRGRMAQRERGSA